ncbi:MAG: 50S ribosomal protein L24 [Clostridia bacterium]|nr:50S ribosomal protein L24 [Clostridia bacterium]
MANNLHVRRDDTVVVISGKEKGKIGKVMTAFPKTGKVIVENVNIVARHTKPRGQGHEGGIIRREAAIPAGKVMLYCNTCKKATRISVKVLSDGSKVRVCKKCGAQLG